MCSSIILSIIVTATIDSAAIMIGDQTQLHLEAVGTQEEQVQMPKIDTELCPGIEVVDRSAVDTSRLSDGRVRYQQTLTLTSFQDSLFYVAPLAFPAGADTLYSEALSLNVVQPFEIDTTLAITDIKPIAKAPIWWWGIIRWILLALLIIAIALGAWWLVRRLGRYTGRYVPEAKPEPLRPAEEVALEKLDAIRQDKIWQTGKTKEYHSELTDVIREYIGRRYEVHSTEKTSDETLRELKPIMKEQPELFQRLRQMLTLADLVKFAKWTTTPDENELSLRTAYDFVHETTPQAIPDNTTDSQQ